MAEVKADTKTSLADYWKDVRKAAEAQKTPDTVIEMFEIMFFMGAATALILQRRLVRPLKDELDTWENTASGEVKKREKRPYIPPTIPDDDREPHDG